jgi:hypothetical protein
MPMRKRPVSASCPFSHAGRHPMRTEQGRAVGQPPGSEQRRVDAVRAGFGRVRECLRDRAVVMASHRVAEPEQLVPGRFQRRACRAQPPLA